jgi:hypothetical protein
VPCGGSVGLANGIFSASGLTGARIDGNSSVVSSIVGPWDTMADDVPCVGGSTACLVASANSSWLGGARSDVGIGTDFCRFGCASVSVEALRFVWASATVGWGHQHLFVVKVGHLVHLPMYPFVAAKQV